MSQHFFVFIGSFASVGLKGLQHKNVIHDLYAWVAITSYAMAFMDVLLIRLIIASNWTIAFASGTGAALGMMGSMYLHNRLRKP